MVGQASVPAFLLAARDGRATDRYSEGAPYFAPYTYRDCQKFVRMARYFMVGAQLAVPPNRHGHSKLCPYKTKLLLATAIKVNTKISL